MSDCWMLVGQRIADELVHRSSEGRPSGWVGGGASRAARRCSACAAQDTSGRSAVVRGVVTNHGPVEAQGAAGFVDAAATAGAARRGIALHRGVGHRQRSSVPDAAAEGAVLLYTVEPETVISPR